MPDRTPVWLQNSHTPKTAAKKRKNPPIRRQRAKRARQRNTPRKGKGQKTEDKQPQEAKQNQSQPTDPKAKPHQEPTSRDTTRPRVHR